MTSARYALGILAAMSGMAWAGDTIGIGAELAYTSDNNVARVGMYEVSDNILSANVNYTWRLPVTHTTRLVVQPFVGAQYYFEYDDLSSGAAGVNLQYQWRPAVGFYSPTIALFAGASADQYSSDQRDGASFRYGLSARSPVTDRIGVYGALARHTRSADHTVFETENNVFTLLFDYAAVRRGTVYLGLEYRNGDVVAGTWQGPTYFNFYGTPWVLDDAFPGTVWTYRADGDTQLYNLGFNYGFNERHALDLSARLIRSSVDLGYEYDTTQFTLAWLGRF